MRLDGVWPVRAWHTSLVSFYHALGRQRPTASAKPGWINILLHSHRYYVLVAACVFARKVEWLRDACLAAALLFPAVAALHGIVLASVHVNGEFHQCQGLVLRPQG